MSNFIKEFLRSYIDNPQIQAYNMYQMIHFSERSAMSVYTSFFEKTFLFNDVDSSTVTSLLDAITLEEKTYQKGSVIYSPEIFDRKIGFIYSGECAVSRYSNGNIIPLNISKQHDSFGILACFSQEDEFPTVITAKAITTVIFMKHDDLRKLLMLCPEVSMNVIKFLTQKINFLNEKIAAFSGGTIEEKLANHLISLTKKHGSHEFSFNKKKSAEALNCGRASLYRALEAMVNAGYILLDDKKIIIKDLKGLERITK